MKKQSTKKISCIGDNGNPVDWWFVYKVAGKSVTSDGSKAKGTEYVYYDSEFPKRKKLVLSDNLIDDPNKGAVSNTLNQIYKDKKDPDLGWFFYNDEDPVTGKTNAYRGHTKGVLAFNLKTNSAFWLIHSTPKFAEKDSFSYPTTAEGNGQTFLCISLKDADEASKIAAQMYKGQQPNIYLASEVPKSLEDVDNDARVQLIKNTVQPGDNSYADAVSFLSAGGKQFLAIAKNKHWNKENDDNFYNDLVSIKLNENLEVETWEHGVEPPSKDSNSKHTVTAMKSVDLAPLKISPSYDWSEENDHAKLTISDKSEKIKYVCVGDLNFTVAQEKRSGGTVAFPCTDLWESLWEIISTKAFVRKKNFPEKSKI